jgi:hypothetical protein
MAASDLHTTNLKSSTMDGQSIGHDGHELGMNFVLMLLVITLQFVELNEHDRLFGIEMASESLADIRNEVYHDRKGLRSESKMLGSDVLETR